MASVVTRRDIRRGGADRRRAGPRRSGHPSASALLEGPAGPCPTVERRAATSAMTTVIIRIGKRTDPPPKCNEDKAFRVLRRDRTRDSHRPPALVRCLIDD